MLPDRAIQKKHLYIGVSVLIVLSYVFFSSGEDKSKAKIKGIEDDRVVDKIIEMTFDTPLFVKDSKTTKVVTIGFGIHEVKTLLKLPEPSTTTMFELSEYDNNFPSASFVLIDWNLYEKHCLCSIYDFLMRIDQSVSRYIGVYVDAKLNNTEKTTYYEWPLTDYYSQGELGLFEFTGRRRAWDFDYPPAVKYSSHEVTLDPKMISRLKPNNFFLMRNIGVKSEESKLFDWLDAYQYPADCSTTRWGMHVHYPSGLGSIIHFMQYMLTWTVINNYTLVVVGHENFGYRGPGCPYVDYRCFFMQHPMGCPFDMNKNKFDHTGYYITLSGLPDNSTYGNVSLFWWRAALNKYLIRPNPILYHMIQENIDFLNNKSPSGTMFPCISMHVRRGDKKFEHAPTEDDIYFKALVKYQKGRADQGLPEIRRIFVMTDDETFVPKISKELPNYKFLALEIDRAGIKPIVGGYEQGMDVMLEIYVAAKCDHFIGTFSSNVGRLIAEMNTLDGYTAESLDSAWHLAP